MYGVIVAKNGAAAPLGKLIGFIDWTKIKINTPRGHGAYQRSVYSEHKHFHCLIYQSLTMPDGLLLAFLGPEVGRRHDVTFILDYG